MLYLLLKWLHLLAVIVVLASNLTYKRWIARVSSGRDALPVLRTIKLIDDRVASPAYGLLLVTAVSMVFVDATTLVAPWRLAAVILSVAVALVGALGYSPTLRRQIQVLESEGFDSASYRALARRSSRLGWVLAVLVILIVLLIALKPGLWG